MEGRIGKYEVQNELGRGSFGRVFRAYDPSVGRPVAIKVLSPESDQELLARFRAEAGMTGQLQHKNIVTVFDCGEQDGAPYIVMELLEGENLQTTLQSKRPLTLLEKMRIMCQIGEGLHYAHQRGVIHRDVKPGNIMLLPNGVVKIMDFGIARLANMGSQRRTRSGDLIGTTSYMAPEQFRGADADARTDVFAYGVIYYEVLSGVHPFYANDVSATIFRIMSLDPLPLREVFPDCPPGLESLVHRAMAKDAARRYSSLDDILIDAEPIMLDLRRDQATQLMVDIKALIAQGNFDAAHVKLKQALELDPSNRDARRVRETLEEERNRRLVEESVQALEREANTKLAKRQFGEALHTFESALRMKPTDSRLLSLVESARSAMLANREASRLLSEAKREAQNDRFEHAKTLATQALTADPDHPEAPPLIKHLQEEIDRIESIRRFKTGIEESEKLLADGAYDQATAKLQSLEAAFPGSVEIRELQARVLARQTEEFRRRRVARLESEIARARQLQNDGEHSEALLVVESLLPDFAGVPVIENMRTSIREEINAQRRASEMTALLGDARSLIWLRHLPESVALLEEGLQKFPGDAGLERLLEAAKILHQDSVRQQALAEVYETGASLRKQNRLEEAMEVLKNGLQAHGHDTQLSDLCRVLTLEIEDLRLSERLRRYLADASALLQAGSVSKALALLREARTQYPTEPALELALAIAEEQYTQQSENEIVASVLQTARDKEKAGDFSGAIEEINKGLVRLPSSKDLLTAASEIQARTVTVEREKNIQRLAAEIQKAMEVGDWAHAATVADSARREYPDQFIFDEMASQIQLKQRTSEVERAVASVREHFKNGNLEWAMIALAQLEPTYGNDKIWLAEKHKIEKRHSFLERLRRAEDWRKNGQYEQAEGLLKQLAAEDPQDAQAAALLKVVTADLLSANPEQVFRKGQQEAEKLQASGDLAGALKVLTALTEQFPGRRELPEAIERLRTQTAAPPPAVVTDPKQKRPRVRFEFRRSAPNVCTNCGSAVPDGARFCDTCGRAVAVASPQ